MNNNLEEQLQSWATQARHVGNPPPIKPPATGRVCPPCLATDARPLGATCTWRGSRVHFSSDRYPELPGDSRAGEKLAEQSQVARRVSAVKGSHRNPFATAMSMAWHFIAVMVPVAARPARHGFAFPRGQASSAFLCPAVNLSCCCVPVITCAELLRGRGPE